MRLQGVALVSASGLSGELAALLRGHLAACRSGATAAMLRKALAELAEPVPRLAIGGRLNAGKSTLVNALLGQRAAATGDTETTTLVSWFRYGETPSTRAVTTGTVDRLEVTLPSPVLADRFTLVDTPGMDSPTGLDPASDEALAQVDAVVYVMPHPGQNDNQALLRVRRQAGGTGLTAANVLGVLSRVDQLNGGVGDPWPTAARIAAGYTRKLKGVTAEVVPVSGLLAEAAIRWADEDTDALGIVGKADPDLLTYGDDFLESTEIDLQESRRHRLLDLIGMYGIRELVAAGPPADSADVRARLRTLSRIDVLAERIDTSLLVSSDRLRCTRILTAVLDECRQAGEPALAADLDDFHERPELTQVRLAAALTDVITGSCHLPDEDLTALEALAGGVDPATCVGLPPDADAADVSAAIDEAVDRWRRWESAPSVRLARHARTASELCQQLYFDHHERRGGT